MKNLLAMSEQKKMLPNVSGSDLLRQKIKLPSDLRGNLNLLLSMAADGSGLLASFST
jgi:hypothetical protein